MYLFCIVSSVYIAYLFSFVPETCRKEAQEQTLEEFEAEEKILYEKELEVKKIEKEFEFLGISKSKKYD